MSTQRPAIGGKVTRKTEEKRQAELDSGVKFTLDEKEYVVRIGDVTPRLARELRRETGCSVMELLNEVQKSPDLDTIAPLMWLAERIKGVDLELDDIELGYADILGDGFDVSEAGPDKDDSPEA